MDSVKIANYGIDNWFKLEEFVAKEEIYERQNNAENKNFIARYSL